MALEGANEKLYSALRGMLRGGSIKERLIAAGRSNLLYVEPIDIPEDKRNDYVAAYNKLVKDKQTGKDVGVVTAVSKLSEDEAIEIAQTLFDVYSVVAEEFGKKYR